MEDVTQVTRLRRKTAQLEFTNEKRESTVVHSDAGTPTPCTPLPKDKLTQPPWTRVKEGKCVVAASKPIGNL